MSAESQSAAPEYLPLTRIERVESLIEQMTLDEKVGQMTQLSMFENQDDARVDHMLDLVRQGNRVEARSRGVGAFRVLLSPEQFDFSQPVTVMVNGKTAFEGAIQKDLRTLLKWAATDNDRTMLFAAETSEAIGDTRATARWRERATATASR